MNKAYISKLTTVVIVTLNGSIIKKMLDSLSKRFKIIIVENSNKLNFKKKIEKKFKNTEVILTGENLGFAKANNIGLKKVRTKYSLVLNPDVIINNEQLIQLENFGNLLKNFGILTCQCNRFDETICSDNFDSQIIFKKKKYLLNSQIRQHYEEVPYVPGWCMMFKTKDLKKINYFDENFFLYFEDRDISKRIIKLNKHKKLFVVNNIKIYHKFGGNSRSQNKQIYNMSWRIRFWHYYWSRFYYYRKHYGLSKSIRLHLTKYLRFSVLYFFYKFKKNLDLSLLCKYKANGIYTQFLNKKAIPIPKI